MLRVAVPNKGSLSEAASAMLSEAGYRQRRDTRELVMVDPDNDIEFFFLRPRDIAVYVGQGTLDVGITGRDLLLDAEVEAEELLPLGFAASTFRFAGPVGDFASVEELEGKRLATSYDGLLRGYLAERGDQRHRWSALTAPLSPPCASVLRTPLPTSSKPATPSRPPAWRSSASPS